MADADPIDALALAEGERVLWQGRPGFGSSRFELRRILGLAVFWWLVAVAPFVVVAMFDPDRDKAWAWLASTAFLFAVIGVPLVVSFMLAKVVGPYHLSFLSLCVCGPIYAVSWSSVALSSGWLVALRRMRPDDFVVAALFLGLPLVRIVVGVLRRKSLVYVVTDRRAAAVHVGAAARLLWAIPLRDGRWLQARVCWPLGGQPVGARRRGHLYVGYGRARRDLLMIEDPDQVLAHVREALAGTTSPRAARKKSAAPAAETEPPLAPPG